MIKMLSQNGKVAEYRNHIIKYPRSVAVNHAGLWIRRHQFESGRGYPDKKLESYRNLFLMLRRCWCICLPQPLHNLRFLQL